MRCGVQRLLPGMAGHPSAGEETLASLELLGFSVCNAPSGDVLQWLISRMEQGHTTHVVTLNPEMVMASRERPELASLIRSADLLVADGVGLVGAARLLGKGKLQRYPGIDLATDLLEHCRASKVKVYLLGAEPGVARLAAANLTGKLAGLNICGVRDGYFSEGQAAAVATEIGELQPDLLLVGMGFPRQEKFIAAHREALGSPLMIGVGGALDVFAGRQRRAPRLIQRMGLEWAYRVARNATRFRRLAALKHFARLILKESIGAAN